jgi:hypothetical protein
MTPDKFKTVYNEKFIAALKIKCQERNLMFAVCDQMVSMSVCMQKRLDPNNNTVVSVENEIYSIFNDGNKTGWDFIGVQR